MVKIPNTAWPLLARTQYTHKPLAIDTIPTGEQSPPSSLDLTNGRYKGLQQKLSPVNDVKRMSKIDLTSVRSSKK